MSVSRKYSDEVAEIRRGVASLVDSALNAKNYSPRSFGIRYHKVLKFESFPGAADYVRRVKAAQGCQSGVRDGTEGWSFTPRELERLPLLLQLLEISPEESCLDHLRKIEPKRFSYS